MITFLAGLVSGAAVVLVTLRVPVWWEAGRRRRLLRREPGWWPFDESAGWAAAGAVRPVERPAAGGRGDGMGEWT